MVKANTHTHFQGQLFSLPLSTTGHICITQTWQNSMASATINCSLLKWYNMYFITIDSLWMLNTRKFIYVIFRRRKKLTILSNTHTHIEREHAHENSLSVFFCLCRAPIQHYAACAHIKYTIVDEKHKNTTMKSLWICSCRRKSNNQLHSSTAKITTTATTTTLTPYINTDR